MTKPRVEVRLDGESVLLYDSVNNVPLGWVGLNRKNGFALAEAEDLAAFGNAVIGHALTLRPNPSAPLTNCLKRNQLTKLLFNSQAA